MTASRFAQIDRRLSERRILTIDLERQAGLTHIFDQRTHGFISAARWLRLPQTLCFAANWYGSREMLFSAAWDDYDAMVRRAWELYDEADIVVTYNGIRADNRWLSDDWVLAGLPRPSTWKNVDLYAVNKSMFGFDSASLDHLCKRLGLPTKSGHYDPFVADACMDGDEKAQKQIRRYCIGDVRITKQCYDRLRLTGWIPNHPHVHPDSATPRCNACGSADLERDGTYLAQVMEYAQYRCQNCQSIVRAGHVRRVATTRGVR